MTTKYDALINAPFGIVAISVDDDQLAIELLPASMQIQQHSPSNYNKQSPHPLVSQACEQILQYLQHPAAKCTLQLNPVGTAFQQRVWQAIAAIPPGQTRTYGQLARQIGSGPRAVANACGANPLPLLIPCHRVVTKNGIGGFMQGLQHGLPVKQWLLQHEGVNVSGDSGE